MTPQAATPPSPDFRLLFERAPGLYLVLTPDLTIVAVSDAYLRETRTQRDELLGKGLFGVFPNDRDDLRTSLDRVRQQLVPDTLAPQSDGHEERPWSRTSTPVLDAQGELAFIIHELKDVTEVETARSELDRFSYSVSHDLRAPLRAVNGFAQALFEDHGAALPAEGRALLARVRDSGKRMGQLIDGLLEFSRLGRKPLTLAPVDLASLVATVVQELRNEHAGRNVEVTIAALPAAMGDHALLRQALTNLIRNAFKFTRLRADARVEIGARDEGGETVYYVRDNGAGFDMRYEQKLFGVFQRLHREEDFEGIGVGLALVQRIIHRHGGRVWAEARVNEGATFYFTLGGA
ncbi:MAG TPA: ATP-binding protein [Gemmatimonadales bacterium]|nr:ATP-binding protein [Gemmatimonadales bacterium]